jgi:hypothetical protein
MKAPRPGAPAPLIPLRPRSGSEFAPAATTPSTPTTNNTDDKSWWKYVLRDERIRHAKVERILTAHNEALERNLADLRTMVISATAKALVGAGR